MPHNSESLCDTIAMWSFQFWCWSTITTKNVALVTLCIASLCKMTSPWGFRFFFLDIKETYICIYLYFNMKILDVPIFFINKFSSVRLLHILKIRQCHRPHGGNLHLYYISLLLRVRPHRAVKKTLPNRERQT